jgi:hypothetical protein
MTNQDDFDDFQLNTSTVSHKEQKIKKPELKAKKVSLLFCQI